MYIISILCLVIYCSKLTSIDLSCFDVENVKDFSFMFYDCQSLMSVDLSTFKPANLGYLNDMFSHCFSLTSIDLSSFDTSNVLNFNNMFFYCYNLTSIDISSFTLPADSKDYIFGLFDNNLPKNGSLKINKEFYNKIKNKFIENWDIKLFGQ